MPPICHFWWQLDLIPHRLEHLSDEQILSLQEAASLLSLERLTIKFVANRKAYDLKSKVIKAK